MLNPVICQKHKAQKKGIGSSCLKLWLFHLQQKICKALNITIKQI